MHSLIQYINILLGAMTPHEAQKHTHGVWVSCCGTEFNRVLDFYPGFGNLTLGLQ